MGMVRVGRAGRIPISPGAATVHQVHFARCSHGHRMEKPLVVVSKGTFKLYVTEDK
jgi:hypothetical protein